MYTATEVCEKIRLWQTPSDESSLYDKTKQFNPFAYGTYDLTFCEDNWQYSIKCFYIQTPWY